MKGQFVCTVAAVPFLTSLAHAAPTALGTMPETQQDSLQARTWGWGSSMNLVDELGVMFRPAAGSNAVQEQFSIANAVEDTTHQASDLVMHPTSQQVPGAQKQNTHASMPSGKIQSEARFSSPSAPRDPLQSSFSATQAGGQVKKVSGKHEFDEVLPESEEDTTLVTTSKSNFKATVQMLTGQNTNNTPRPAPFTIVRKFRRTSPKTGSGEEWTDADKVALLELFEPKALLRKDIILRDQKEWTRVRNRFSSRLRSTKFQQHVRDQIKAERPAQSLVERLEKLLPRSATPQ